jgi:putative ABC transport system substrate-binding protein
MDAEFRGFSEIWNVIQSTAPSLGIEVFRLDARDSASIDVALQRFSQQPNAGVTVLPTPANAVHREHILSFTAEHRLPAVYPSYFAKEGGLIAYGFDSRDLFRRAAAYVARLLEGARAGDLPVQAPTKYELVINPNSLGLTLPPGIPRSRRRRH